MFMIRELQRNDMSIINKWRNDPSLIASLGAPFRYINPEVDLNWFDLYLDGRNNNIRCSILDDNQVVGLVSLTGIDYIHRNAEVHIMIGSADNRSRGVGTFALEQIVYHAFYNLNLHRLELGVLADNKQAINLYEKVGFIEEGIRRKAVYKNGKYVDIIHYGLIIEDFINSSLSTTIDFKGGLGAEISS